MDSAFSTMGFVIFGFTFSMYAFLVESRLSPSPSPSPPPPSPPSPSPRPPSLSLAPPRPDSPRQWDRASENPEPKAKRSPPNHIHHHYRRSPPPPPPAHQMNGGKKIGLLFAGIAAIMQIGVVGFLVYKRSQLLKTKDLFETGS